VCPAVSRDCHCRDCHCRCGCRRDHSSRGSAWQMRYCWQLSPASPHPAPPSFSVSWLSVSCVSPPKIRWLHIKSQKETESHGGSGLRADKRIWGRAYQPTSNTTAYLSRKTSFSLGSFFACSRKAVCWASVMTYSPPKRDRIAALGESRFIGGWWGVSASCCVTLNRSHKWAKSNGFSAFASKRSSDLNRASKTYRRPSAYADGSRLRR